MIASSPSGATVRSQSAEITPAPALPLPFPSAEPVCACRTGLAGKPKSPLSCRGGRLILAQSLLNKWKILIKMSSSTTGTGNPSQGHSRGGAGWMKWRIETIKCREIRNRICNTQSNNGFSPDIAVTPPPSLPCVYNGIRQSKWQWKIELSNSQSTRLVINVFAAW